MKTVKSVSILCLMCSVLISCKSTDEERIDQLERRMTELEESMQPAIAEQTRKKTVEEQRIRARERMRKDINIYTQEQLREIENLYQVANKKWGTKEGKKSLEELISKYGKANRTGCALLYLGQMSKDTESEKYLKDAIENYSDCFYGNGVQVGAYARFYLAYFYKKKGEDKKAERLFKDISKKYPDAINHKGRLLSDVINK